MNACQDGFLIDDSVTDSVAKDLAKFNTVLSRLRARRVEAIVTVRERDTTTQVRVPIDALVAEMRGRLGC